MTDETSVRSSDLHEGYQNLLGLYERMESVTAAMFQALKEGSQISRLTVHLKENMELADRIRSESRMIAELKKTLTELNLLSDTDRHRARDAEQKLAELVTRVVEQEKMSSELMKKQGVKISRR